MSNVEHMPPCGESGELRLSGVCPSSYQILPQGLSCCCHGQSGQGKLGSELCSIFPGWGHLLPSPHRLAVSPICHLSEMGATAPSHTHSAAYRELEENRSLCATVVALEAEPSRVEAGGVFG